MERTSERKIEELRPQMDDVPTEEDYYWLKGVFHKNDGYHTPIVINPMRKDGQHGIPVPDYVDENVSTKVVKIIQSYVGIVNKMVWRKF